MQTSKENHSSRFDRIIGAVAFSLTLALGVAGAVAPVLWPTLGIDLSQTAA